ncbi:MAG: hypothetical protein HC844_08375 [Tabrizicola sp.]|nr:hypothetical protein [Tabrizicola sp.]
MIAIKGDAMYSVQWARRGPASAERLAPDSAALASRLEALMTGLRLCPVVPGEAEPYPSCTGG